MRHEPDDAVLLDEHASLRQQRGAWSGSWRTNSPTSGSATYSRCGGGIDLWLNEGFATWTTYKVVDAYKPAFGTRIDAAASAESIMDADGLASARAIRQPVASVGQAMEAFDGITYQKGAAVLRMIEHYVGEDVFQRGVHAYLSEHAWGNATAADLLGAIDTAAGKHDATDIASAYLDRPGVPLVVIDALDCDKEKAIHVHEERFVPLGANMSETPAEPWKVPFCTSASKTAKPECKLLGLEPATVSVTGSCPVYANPDAVGYYRVAWPWGAIPSLVRSQNTQRTRRPVWPRLADMWAQARAGKLSATLLLRIALPQIDKETDRRVIEKLVSVLFELAEIVDDATWPSYSAYVRARLAPHLARLDKIPEAKLDDDQRLLRRTLTYAQVELGEDAALQKKMEGIAKNPHPPDPDYAQVARELAARTTDAAVLRAAVEQATTPQDHAIALRAASGVTDSAAVKAQALDWALSPTFKLQDVRGVLWPLASRRRSRPVVLAYVREHWDMLRKKLPGQLGRGLVGLAGYACTQPSPSTTRARTSPTSRRTWRAPSAPSRKRSSRPRSASPSATSSCRR